MITVYTKPVPTNQRTAPVNGRQILTRKYRDAKEVISWEIASQWKGELLEEEGIAVNILVYYKGKRPDIDAYEKILLDAMEGIVYTNDGLVTEKHTFRMLDEENPRVELQII